MPNEDEAIASLQREVRRLNIRINTLVNFLNSSNFGGPLGREPYDSQVESNLAALGLQETIEDEFTRQRHTEKEPESPAQ